MLDIASEYRTGAFILKSAKVLVILVKIESKYLIIMVYIRYILLIVFFNLIITSIVVVDGNENLITTSSKRDYIIKNILKTNMIPDDEQIDTTNYNYNINDDKNDDDTNEDQYDRTFVQLYYDGVKSYLVNDFENCVNNLERSINLYHDYYDALSFCRIRCEFERNQYQLMHDNIDDYDHREFFERLIAKTLCLEKCRKNNMENVSRYFLFKKNEREIFRMRKPYEYLQLCYYREGEVEKAISATYTVLVMNPGDELMKKNIQYYAKMREFDYNSIQDYEEKKYSRLYRDGIDKYEKKEYKEAIELLEISLDSWLQENEKCRAFCENEFDQGWLREFTAQIANHYVYALRCKQNCTTDTSFVNGRYFEDFFPSYYNYLQFAYYQVNQIEEACRAVGSFLLFEPTSEEMLSNLQFYKNLPNVKDDYFEPRSEAKKIFYRDLSENDLLIYVDKAFPDVYKDSDDGDGTDDEPWLDDLQVNNNIDNLDNNLITEDLNNNNNNETTHSFHYEKGKEKDVLNMDK